jgi:hypothetical protein
MRVEKCEGRRLKGKGKGRGKKGIMTKFSEILPEVVQPTPKVVTCEYEPMKALAETSNEIIKKMQNTTSYAELKMYSIQVSTFMALLPFLDIPEFFFENFAILLHFFKILPTKTVLPLFLVLPHFFKFFLIPYLACVVAF